MSQQFQVFVDARGNLLAADGLVFCKTSGVAWEVGTDDDTAGSDGSLAMHLGDALEIPRVAGVMLLGGSGRNVIVTGLAGLSGIYLPGRPGEWKNGQFLLQVSGSSSATISDATDIIAELTSGGSAPAGNYVATAYGESTYNASATFTLVGAAETGWPGAPNEIELIISAGTAMGGRYVSSNGVDYVSTADPDWTITLAADGSVELAYLTEVVARRPAGEPDDPCGICEATPAGLRLNPEFGADDDSPAPAVNPFGLLTLEFSWSGTPDLDIGVKFLGRTVGYGYDSSAPYMTWGGDNITDGGPETVAIDLAEAWDAGEIDTFADVLALADWYPPAGGSGPASVTVTYDGGAPAVHALHPSSASPAVTPALALRVLADGSVSTPGGDWTATVMAVRRAPVAGVVYLSVTETSGEISAVSGPHFAATLPTSGGGVFYYPLATSNGTGVIKQLHTGPLLWVTE
jgi:hypothetical protein